MRDLDNENGGEGLPCQLGDRCNGSNEGVLVPGEVGVCLQTEDSSVAKDTLVEYLQEVYPDKDDEYDSVGLSTDALVLQSLVSQILTARKSTKSLTSSSVNSTRSSPM